MSKTDKFFRAFAFLTLVFGLITSIALLNISLATMYALALYLCAIIVHKEKRIERLEKFIKNKWDRTL